MSCYMYCTYVAYRIFFHCSCEAKNCQVKGPLGHFVKGRRSAYIYIYLVQQSNSGLGHFIVEVSRLHTIRHTHTHTHTATHTATHTCTNTHTHTTHTHKHRYTHTHTQPHTHTQTTHRHTHTHKHTHTPGSTPLNK